MKGDHQNVETRATIIELLKNGRIIIKGKLSLKSANGEQELEKEMISFYRCVAYSKKTLL